MHQKNKLSRKPQYPERMLSHARILQLFWRSHPIESDQCLFDLPTNITHILQSVDQPNLCASVSPWRVFVRW
jgi:hypothetical protein